MDTQAKGMRLVGQNDLGGLGDCMHVNVVGNHAYIGHMGYNGVGTSIVDVADPENPVLVHQIPRPAGTHTHKVQVLGDIMLVNHERNRFEDTPPDSWSAGLAVYDVSKPDAPQQIGFLECPGTGVHRMTYWDEPYAYVSGTDTDIHGRFVRIVDLSRPDRPREVGRWWYPGQHEADEEPLPFEDVDGKDAQIHHALPRGDRLYAGWWDLGLVILDISDPEQPKLVSHVDFGEDSGNTHTALPVPGRDLLVVTDEQLTRFIGTQRHVRVIDISDERNPRVIAKLPIPRDAEEHHEQRVRFGPHNLHEPRPGSLVDSDTVYLTYFAGGLRSYDISDPHEPRELGYIVPAPPPGREAIQFNDVTATPDGLVYVTDRHGAGLYIVHDEQRSSARDGE